MKTYSDILTMDVNALADWLEDEFVIEIPNEILTIDDMNEASRLLLRLSSYYSYVTALLTRAENATRYAKRNLSKQEYEDMVDRKKAISAMVDIVKQEYSAISRAVTIHIENNQELRFSSNGKAQ